MDDWKGMKMGFEGEGFGERNAIRSGLDSAASDQFGAARLWLALRDLGKGRGIAGTPRTGFPPRRARAA